MSNSYQASWEDEENNRHILFHVEYGLAEPSVTIDSITPLNVSFLCPETNQPLRQVGIHTERGRALLVRQFLAAGQLALLQQELMLVASVASVAAVA